MTTITLPPSVVALLTRTTPPTTRAPEESPQGRRAAYVISRAEAAECTCPSFCERDHGNE